MIFKKLRQWKMYRKLMEKEKLLRSVAIGMNSSIDIEENLHIVMIDYDVKSLDAVEDSVWELQDFWGLSDAYIYQTKNGFHVFFWYDHVPYERLRMIIDYAKHADPMYKYISRYYNHKTIRVAGKYKQRDIFFVKKIHGIRTPLQDELERGELKRREHSMLLQAT